MSLSALPLGALRAACCAALTLSLALAGCSSDDELPNAQAPGPTPAEVPPPPANRASDVPPPWEAGDPALGGLRFTDVTAEAGLGSTHSDLGLVAQEAMTSGVAVADVDRDGDDDVFLARVGKPDALFMNDGTGHFTDVAQQAGVAGPSSRFGSAAAAFADFDGDGDLDLFVAGAGLGTNTLYVNNGEGGFSDGTEAAGLQWPDPAMSEEGTQIHGVSVADVNRDGHMDLLVLQWFHPLYGEAGDVAIRDEFGIASDATADPPPTCAAAAALRARGWPLDSDAETNLSALWMNDGSGAFTDATAEFELPLEEIVAFTGVFTDLDADGWQDLTITGDGCTSRVFRNVDGTRFEDVTATSGTATDENAMGSVIRDIDLDGRPDWFITSISYPHDGDCTAEGFAVGCSGNRLFLNRGDMEFTDGTDSFGLRDGGWGWGAAIEDLNNDGTYEVVMNNGFAEPGAMGAEGTTEQPDTEYYRAFLEDRTRLWVWDDATDTYRDAAAAVGIDDTTVGHGLVTFDMDRDGDLDLLSVPTNEAPRLYRNDTPATSHWLAISLVDPATPGTSWGDGARVEVTPRTGGDTFTDWVTTGGSYETQGPPEFHIGLGPTDDTVDLVEVFWPGESDPQRLTDVTADELLVVRRPG